MSEIIKTQAFVLNKINYGDTSSIVSLFTKDYGRFSAIIKGGRSPKSKIGKSADPINHIDIILYKKDTREVQILTGVDLISHYLRIKDDFEKLKFAHAIIELIKKLTPEHEANKRLFNGIERILYLIENSNEIPKVLFGRFFIFFLAEIGYEIQLAECVSCGRKNLNNEELSYNLGAGLLCSSCKKNYFESFLISPELFNCLLCLKKNKEINYSDKIIDRAISFMELYLKYHVSDFKGIRSLQLS